MHAARMHSFLLDGAPLTWHAPTTRHKTHTPACWPLRRRPARAQGRCDPRTRAPRCRARTCGCSWRRTPRARAPRARARRGLRAASRRRTRRAGRPLLRPAPHCTPWPGCSLRGTGPPTSGRGARGGARRWEVGARSSRVGSVYIAHAGWQGADPPGREHATARRTPGCTAHGRCARARVRARRPPTLHTAATSAAATEAWRRRAWRRAVASMGGSGGVGGRQARRTYIVPLVHSSPGAQCDWDCLQTPRSKREEGNAPVATAASGGAHRELEAGARRGGRAGDAVLLRSCRHCRAQQRDQMGGCSTSQHFMMLTGDEQLYTGEKAR